MIALAIFIIISHPFIGTIDLIQDVFTKAQSGWEMLDNSYVSGERLGMISYALSEKDIRWTEAGVGRYAWQESFGLNFAHFGISDFGTFLCLGGVVFVLLLLLFLWSVYRSFFCNTVAAIIFLLATIFVLIYTQLFTVTSLMCSWTFLGLITVIESNLSGNKRVEYLNENEERK